MRLILDSNILRSLPEILSQGGGSIHFLLPQAAYQELASGRLAERFSELLGSASRAGRLQILTHPSDDLTEIPHWKRLSIADALILQTALQYQKQHADQNVYLVSDDIPLVMQANKLGLQTATSKTVSELIKSAPNGGQVSKELSDAADSLDRFNRNYLVQGFLLGTLVTVIVFTAWHFRQAIGQAFPLWGLTVVTALFGIFLFRFRSRYRLAYGFAEVLFGLIAAARLASPSTYDSTFVIQLVASLYIIVRGLDNIEKGIQGTKVEPKWKHFFYGSNGA
jgi:hypothetical protein